MPDNREGYVKLGFDVDQTSINQVKAANDAILKSVEQIGGAATKTSAAFARLKEVSSTIGRANDIDTIGKQFATLGKAIGDDTTALIQMRQVLKEIGASSSEIDKATRSFKEMQAATVEQSGGGKFGVEGIRRTGSAISALGGGEIGGVVSRVGDVAQITKEFEELGKVTQGLPGLLGNVATEGAALGGSLGAVAAVAGPVVVVLGALAVGLKLFSDGVKGGKEALDAALATQKDYYDKAAYYTTEQAKQEVENLEKRATAQQNAANETEGALKRLEEQMHVSRDVGIALPRELGDGFRALTKQLDDEKKALGETQSATGRWEGGLKSGALAANDAAEAEKRLTAERLKGIDRQMASEIEYQELIKHGTSDQAKKQIDALQIQADAIANAYSKAIEGTDKDSQARAAQLKEQYDTITNHIKDLKALVPDLVAGEKAKQFFPDLIKGIADAAQKAAPAMKDLAAQIADALKADERVAAVQQKFNDATAKIEETDKAARLGAFEKYEDTVQGIEQKSLQARADLQTKYADKLVDIAQNAADNAAKALEGLQQKQADLRTALGRDEQKAGRDAADKVLDVQIKAQKAERDALQEHLERIKEIRRGDYVQDQKDLLDRNFQAIYLRRLGQTQQIEQENTKFGQDTHKRQQATQDEVQDAQRQAQIARRERLIAFEQANADAKLAYQRERVAAEQARQIELRNAKIGLEREIAQQQVAKQRELQVAQQSYQRELDSLTRKLAAERQALIASNNAELKIAAQYGKARVDMERKTQEALLAQARSRLNALTGGTSGGSRPAGHGVAEMAGGGWLEAGQMAMVNEPGSSGRESFGGVPLPGQGLFIPMQSGMVNPNGGTGGKAMQQSNTFYIQAHDTEGVKREVVGVLKQVMTE